MGNCYQHNQLGQNPTPQGSYYLETVPDIPKPPRLSRPSSSYASLVSDHMKLTEGAEATYNFMQLGSSVSESISINKDTKTPIYFIRSIKSTYQGNFLNGKPHGKGRVHFKNGSFFQGNFQNGQAQGIGTFIYPNGALYFGNFKQSQFEGYGTFKLPQDELQYSGRWAASVPNGEGQQIYSDGSHFMGFFKNGEKDGLGEYIWPNGIIYRGNFKNNVFNGHGVLSKKQLIIFQGQFQRGMKQGPGVYTTSLGAYEGTFIDDHLEGEGIFMWNSGKIYKGMFVKSKFHGQGAIYYPSTLCVKGTWKEGHSIEISESKKDPDNIKLLEQVQQRIKKYQRQGVGKGKLRESEISNIEHIKDSHFRMQSQASIEVLSLKESELKPAKENLERQHAVNFV